MVLHVFECKLMVFWDVTSSDLVGKGWYQHVRGIHCLHLQGTPETLVLAHQITLQIKSKKTEIALLREQKSHL
jgi:hypothetical protein